MFKVFQLNSFFKMPHQMVFIGNKLLLFLLMGFDFAYD